MSSDLLRVIGLISPVPDVCASTDWPGVTSHTPSRSRLTHQYSMPCQLPLTTRFPQRRQHGQRTGLTSWLVSGTLTVALLVGCSRDDADTKEYHESPLPATSAAPETDETPADSTAQQPTESQPSNLAQPQTATERDSTGDGEKSSASSAPAETAMTAPAEPTATNGDAPPQQPASPSADTSTSSANSQAPGTPAAASNGSPNSPAAGNVAKSDKPRKVTLLVPQKSFKVEGPQKAVRVTYDDIDLLRVLNMEPVTADAPQYFPDWLKKLNGRRIRLRGFMYPPLLETGLTSFALARDNQICCFGRNPKIYDLFRVDLRDGVTVDYIQNRPFDVVGVFHIQPESIDGQLFQLYRIDDAVVID